jgi:hypothetical protein
MDSSMQQKVALTTAHFPVRGRIVDMGSGSGRGTFDQASLLSGIGVNRPMRQLMFFRGLKPMVSF